MTKLTASAGIVFFGLLVVIVLTGGGEPPTNEDATAASVRAFYEQQGGAVRLGKLLVVLLGFALLVFAVHVRTALRQADEETLGTLALAGGGSAAVLTWLVAFFSALPAMVPLAEVEDSTVTSLYAFAIDGGEVLAEIAALPLGLFVGAAALGALRAGLLARTACCLGLASAVLLLVGPIALLQPLREANEGAWSLPWFLGFVLFLVWMPAASLSALRRDRGRARELVLDGRSRALGER